MNNNLFRKVGHFFAFPFVIFILRIKLFSIKKKGIQYSLDNDLFSKEQRYKMVYNLTRLSRFLFNINLHVEGIENIPKKPVLFVSNHKSNMDSVLITKILFEIGNIPFFNFIAKSEVKDHKYSGGSSLFLDTIFIDRNNPRDIVRIVEEQNKRIKENSIIIFPEGTRIETDKIETYYPASFQVAYNNLVPIVPIVIYGTKGILKEKEKNRFKYKDIYVSFLKPIKHSTFLNIDKGKIGDQIRIMTQKEYDRLSELKK